MKKVDEIKILDKVHSYDDPNAIGVKADGEMVRIPLERLNSKKANLSYVIRWGNNPNYGGASQSASSSDEYYIANESDLPTYNELVAMAEAGELPTFYCMRESSGEDVGMNTLSEDDSNDVLYLINSIDILWDYGNLFRFWVHRYQDGLSFSSGNWFFACDADDGWYMTYLRYDQ